MDNQNIENTLKKMAIVLDKVVKKVDELDRRVSKLEQQILAEKGKEEKQTTETQTPVSQPIQPQQSGFTSSGFGGSFLGSLLGSFAGLSLFNLLFNNSVSAEEVAKEAGVEPEALKEIDEKLDEISQQIEEVDQKIENIEEEITSDDDYYSEFIDDDIPDIGFDDTFDSFDI